MRDPSNLHTLSQNFVQIANPKVFNKNSDDLNIPVKFRATLDVGSFVSVEHHFSFSDDKKIPVIFQNPQDSKVRNTKHFSANSGSNYLIN